MIFPAYKEITAQTLRDLQAQLELSNKEIAHLVGVSDKTWLNRISAGSNRSVKLLSKLEYAYLVELAYQKRYGSKGTLKSRGVQ